MMVVLIVVLAVLTGGCLAMSLHLRQRARAAEHQLELAHAELRQADDTLRQFQYEQMELMLKIRMNHDPQDDLSSEDIAYVYQSLGVPVPRHIQEMEEEREREAS